jgi:putative flippase GtrA
MIVSSCWSAEMAWACSIVVYQFPARAKPRLKLSFILCVMSSAHKHLHRIPNWHVLVQFVKFGLVGVSNTLIAFAVYTVLLKVFGVWYIAASGIGFAVGAVNGFLLNRRWTFREHVGDSLTPVRWGVVQSCGLGCNLALVYLFVHGLGMDELLGQIPATAIVTVLTFIVNRAWTFRVHTPPAADSA